MTENNTQVSPGQLLRSKREELEISLDDIAGQLHLEIKMVEALERDDHDNLPGATYIRGYLRAYAKAVGIDGDHIIQLFDSGAPPTPPEILPEVKHHSQVSSSDKPVKAVTYLITLSLVILMLIWYQSHYVVNEETSPDATGLASPETEAVSKPAFDYEFSVIEHPQGWRFPNERKLTGSDMDITEPEEEMLLQMTELQMLDKTQNTATNTDTVSGPDEIKMVISQDSWVEITDAQGKRLFFDIAKAGKEIQLAGQAPFDILLGFSPGVKIFYQDQPFDTAPYSKNGVARFTLGN